MALQRRRRHLHGPARACPRTGPAVSSSYLNGWLHYFGGTNKARTADVADHWALQLSNLGAGWQRRASLSNGRHHMGSAVLDGSIYAIGGQHHHDAHLMTQATVEEYDPGADRVDAPGPASPGRAATSPAPRSCSPGASWWPGARSATATRIADVNAYDPGRNSWVSLTPAARRPRPPAWPGRSGDGFVYIGGGWRGGWRATPA